MNLPARWIFFAMSTPRTALRRLLVVLATLAAAVAAQPAAAYNVTCAPSNTLIDFGPFDVLSGATLPAAGTVTLTCTRDAGGGAPVDVTYTATLSSSLARQMAPPAGSDRVSYQVYVDAARTQPWGDGTGGTFTISGAPITMHANDTNVVTFNYYGLITPGGQDVSAASPGPPPTTYSQILTISVTCTPSPPC